ncbi:uncharacterized protein L3040_007449 [Drepanopeziza brunnea f. sp. 'multigermtubi']|uniref:non-specific serine/threonine protein kinase n=1 Tax=Marssonina brunnea f. sp. multigermtubi (strain MB_m1) TaxID=1072389 RepID=K1XCN4_MARBU|nr:Kinase, NEK [Drepanopeziza brunnea f. sp. 'multigermtubi' MB_m1]EKD18528.1 Kinase, NEK [Drepanopeziza brunnea f. sp. 'multigermtubi' MB_m1]KAJ5037272.1 hypothetical protein L3040_007449 [Drepanopeziza brunnea f. sp. 'multigermtubi']
MAAAITNETLKQINFWRQYRNPNDVPLSIRDAARIYRTFPYTPPTPAPAGAPRNITTDPSPDDPDVVVPLGQVFRDFIGKTIAGIPVDPAYWKGRKFLGSGGTAMAGLWEWDGPPEKMPGYTQVVVKELQPGHYTDAIYNESIFLTATYYTGSHIVKMLHPAYALCQGAMEGLDDEWDGVYIRMFQEYCSLGSLEQLLMRRIDLQKPFKETTLWIILNCLVDGLMALEFGSEDPNQPFADWVPIVHLDLKPDNVMLAEIQDGLHSLPILKLIDFGSAGFIDPNNPPSDEDLERWRLMGTEDYYTPEQFTEEWDFKDFKASKIAGAYGPCTNVWGIGVIMFQLLTLSNNPPDHKQPFLPQSSAGNSDGILNGAPAVGNTYGNDMRAYSYSKSLVDTIFECLYETPGLRPSIAGLKQRIGDGFALSMQLQDPSIFEQYEDLARPEPI